MQFKRNLAILCLVVAIVIVLTVPKIKSQFSPPSFSTPPADSVPASFFGMHIHHALETWPNVPFHGWRLWDAYVTWGDLESQQGDWKFELLDQYVELATKKQVEILLTLGQTPRWASARPNDESPYGNSGWPAEPADLQTWRNYIRTVATRYKGKIHYYEVWNEPDSKGFYTGSVDKMVELSREAYRMLKQIDPTNVVLSPGMTDHAPNLEWQKTFFQQGGGKNADVISQHFYPQTSIPEDLVDYISQMKAIMAEYGLADKPLWNTESGWLKPTTIKSDREAMAYVARTYLVNWVGGVKRLYWYAWDNQAAVSLYFTEADGRTPSNVSQSYRQVQNWIVGAQLQKHEVDSTKTWILHFSRNKKLFWIVWNPNQELSFTIPKSWVVQNIQDLSGKIMTLPTSRHLTVDFSPLLLFAEPPS